MITESLAIGANIIGYWKNNPGETFNAYVSFGSFNAETSQDQFGVNDSSIFFYFPGGVADMEEEYLNESSEDFVIKEFEEVGNITAEAIYTPNQLREIEASEDQGITAIATELFARGITSHIDQTGGFNMVGRVQFDEEEDYPYLTFTAECLALVGSEEEEGKIIAEFTTFLENGEAIVNARLIATTIISALEAFSPFREDNDDLVCGGCGTDNMTVNDGELTIQAGTFLEFTCTDCLNAQEAN